MQMAVVNGMDSLGAFGRVKINGRYIVLDK